MTDTTARPRPRAGRPTREQAESRHRELLDTALELFLRNGFEMTTIEMIAGAVGMTKRTVYARYPDKATLFLTAVQRAIERQIVPREALEELDRGDLAETLEAIAQMRISQVATPEGVRLQRIINTEGYRFPTIFTAHLRQSSRPLIEYIAGLLDRAVAAGEIAPTDTMLAASSFMSMVVGGSVRLIVNGRPPAQEEIDRKVHFTVHLLLDGLRPR